MDPLFLIATNAFKADNFLIVNVQQAILKKEMDKIHVKNVLLAVSHALILQTAYPVRAIGYHLQPSVTALTTTQPR